MVMGVTCASQLALSRRTGQAQAVVEAANLGQAQIGGDTVARLQQDDVARHEFSGGHPLLVSVPSHGGLGAHHLGEGLDGAFGLGLLDEPDDRVAEDDAEDDGGIHPFAERGGDDGGGEENVHQRLWS
jgi:hypothetical protein